MLEILSLAAKVERTMLHNAQQISNKKRVEIRPQRTVGYRTFCGEGVLQTTCQPWGLTGLQVTFTSFLDSMRISGDYKMLV